MKKLLTGIFILISLHTYSQISTRANKDSAKKWADSVYSSLTEDERIAQLAVVRLSAIDLKTMKVTFYDSLVSELVKKYNIGGICVFQGGPQKQAIIINSLQQSAKTPLLISMDAEWGVGQRLLDSVLPLPRQMMLGAVNDPSIIYKYGQVVAQQCKRFGINMDFAPVVDVNNNPNNPVINDRSFGENKFKVALYGIQYMKGLQESGVMACAKHFPGHGDVSTDSHYDLPLINKSVSQLDSLELYPFRKIFNAGIASTMIAHLYIPALDKTSNTATSLSKNSVTGLLRDSLHFEGLVLTDALDMQAVKKYWPSGKAAVQALVAGNDMLLLPENVPAAIADIRQSITNNVLSWSVIAEKCKKVLAAKYLYRINEVRPIRLENLSEDLNRPVSAMRRLVAENAITLLARKNPEFFPLTVNDNAKKNEIAYLGIGLRSGNAFGKSIALTLNADTFYFDFTARPDSEMQNLAIHLAANYKKIIIGIHNISRSPVNNFGISAQAVALLEALQRDPKVIVFIFGNAYAAKNCCSAANLVLCYEDDAIVQQTALEMLLGKLPYQGTIPVSACEKFTYGTGLSAGIFSTPGNHAFFAIDSIVHDAIDKKAMPGCVVLIAKNGKIAYHKAFGNYTYDNEKPVTTESIYDAASLTKTCATTLAVMKLFDQGKIDLKKTIGDYLPWIKGSDKEKITLEKLLIHEAGLPATISFYKETLDSAGSPSKLIYSDTLSDSFNVRVAAKLFLRRDWKDTLLQRIRSKPLNGGKYVYSDNDFIFLGQIVESVSGMPLNEFVKKYYYAPMGLTTATFKPLEHFPVGRIVPTIDEKTFRKQVLQGDVHDPGAAMLGGVAGHAGLFSNAYDLAVLMQMLLNGGSMNGKNYISKETIDLFTAYHGNESRRGYGFDKPEKDNNSRQEPYPAPSASPQTFGHTGYTGTCAWADPANGIVFILMSNRVYPSTPETFGRMNIRGKVMEAAYKAFQLK